MYSTFEIQMKNSNGMSDCKNCFPSSYFCLILFSIWCFLFQLLLRCLHLSQWLGMLYDMHLMCHLFMLQIQMFVRKRLFDEAASTRRPEIVNRPFQMEKFYFLIDICGWSLKQLIRKIEDFHSKLNAWSVEHWMKFLSGKSETREEPRKRLPKQHWQI